MPKNLKQVRVTLPELKEDTEKRLSGFAKYLFAGSLRRTRCADKRILAMDAKLNTEYEQNALCQRISALEGVVDRNNGFTAVVAAIADGRTFRNGGSSQPGSGSSHGSTPAEKNSGSSVSQSAGIPTYALFSFMGLDRLFSVLEKKRTPVVNGFSCRKATKKLGTAKSQCSSGKQTRGSFGRFWPTRNRTAAPRRKTSPELQESFCDGVTG